MSDAKILCEKRQMDLIKIETPAEQDLLSSFLSSQCKIYLFLLIILLQ